MMASRDDFIAQLIAALEENEALATDGSDGAAAAADGSPTSQSFASSAASNRGGGDVALVAYEALQFDFPEVVDSQLLALAAKYQSIVDQSAGVIEAAQFALTAKMVDSLEHLNDSINKCRGSEASGLLAAAVLLLVPRFCLEHPESEAAKALMAKLRPPSLELPSESTVAERQARLDQYAASAATPAAEEEEEDQFSGGFVEIYAAEEDPDDLSLVYEGDVPVTHPRGPVGKRDRNGVLYSTAAPTRRSDQLHFLAGMTYSTCFSQISSDKWVAWKMDDALCDLADRLLEGNADVGQVFGVEGEWRRYLFVFRDQLLRFSESSDACAGGLAKLKELISRESPSHLPTGTGGNADDPFFSFGKPSAPKTATSDTASQRLRVVFRVFAELAVSKEFNSLSARKSQHSLAATIQQLFPTILRELQSLAAMLTAPTFEADHSDFVVVLLQLLHFVVDAAGVTAASHRLMIDKLHDSGMLRAWLAFLPATEESYSWPWLFPLLRLFGESALWNADFATYVHRVPKISTLLVAAQSDPALFSCEALLLRIAAYQQNVPLPGTAAEVVWNRFKSEIIFPASCGSFLCSMQKMADALFLLDALAKAISTLRPGVADELRINLQTIYSTRFTTAFQYPTFTVPAAIEDTLNKDEPEPPPREEEGSAQGSVEEQKADEAEERGRAEALQFLALRNRLRQSVKAILLSRMTKFSSSKLD